MALHFLSVITLDHTFNISYESDLITFYCKSCSIHNKRKMYFFIIPLKTPVGLCCYIFNDGYLGRYLVFYI